MLRALVTLALLPTALVVAGTASSAAATCEGLPATVVGAPGEVATGTSGSDVIVANGSIKVRAYAGNDVICLTGAQRYDVEAGDGDDRVQVAPGYDRMVVFPGTGSDTVLGGAGPDSVAAMVEDGADLVRTFAGDDNVSTVESVLGESVTVELGAGDDQFAPTYTTGGRSRAEVVGGDGPDTLYLELARIDGLEAFLDIEQRIFQEDGQDRMISFAGFDDYELSGVSEAFTQRVTVVSDDRANRVTLWSVRDADIDLGRGNDRVRLRSGSDLQAGSDLAGGPGRDLVRADGNFTYAVEVDLTQGSLTASGATSRLHGFEDAIVDGKARITGNARPNQLQGSCRSVIEGRGGDDLLIGSGCGDTLIGGPGRDRAWGQGGVDTCVAEVERRCER